jgi:hypothetical protein
MARADRKTTTTRTIRPDSIFAEIDNHKKRHREWWDRPDPEGPKEHR